MQSNNQVPTFDRLMNPLLKALRTLGGSGTIDEIYQKVIEDLDLPVSVLEIIHDPERGSATEVQYRLAWARTYLKKYGILENSARGVWSLVPDKLSSDEIDARSIVRQIRRSNREKKVRKKVERQGRTETPQEPASNEAQEFADDEVPEEAQGWRERLFHILTKELDPSAFERLIKRLLRESGFVQVEVTGMSGDGGIDGKGIARINGILSFHVIFQCKRYQGAVPSSAIRDFRGAMVGRADKGLFVTTGTFTRDAIKEATRDGAPPIDTIDGNQLADKLKELSLGIKTEIVEQVEVDASWFKNI